MSDLRFGKSAAEAEKEEPRGGGGGDYIRYLKQGDTTFRILQEPEEWIYIWEHFNPGGFPFPCTNERDTCPGCTSEIQKMRSASRLAIFQTLQSFNGQEYVNAFKVPSRVADKLKNRHERIGTVTDRDYTISKYKGQNDKVDYDVEGNDKSPVNVSSYKDQFKDVEAMLARAFEESWGDPTVSRETQAKAAAATESDDLKSKIAKNKAEAEAALKRDMYPEDPPSEPEADAKAKGEDTVSEEYLRGLEPSDLREFAESNGWGAPPPRLKTTDAIVDWMMSA